MIWCTSSSTSTARTAPPTANGWFSAVAIQALSRLGRAPSSRIRRAVTALAHRFAHSPCCGAQFVGGFASSAPVWTLSNFEQYFQVRPRVANCSPASSLLMIVSAAGSSRIDRQLMCSSPARGDGCHRSHAQHVRQTCSDSTDGSLARSLDRADGVLQLQSLFGTCSPIQTDKDKVLFLQQLAWPVSQPRHLATRASCCARFVLVFRLPALCKTTSRGAP